MSDQLSLFGQPEPTRTPRQAAVDAALEASRARGAVLRAALPDGVLFGTSSWTFPGWAGIVYPATLPATALAREGLRHYAAHPLLGTVGIDRSYYAPIPLDDLRAYADHLPAGFPCCLKAPATVTSRVEPAFGSTRRSLRMNPDFLSVDRLEQDLLSGLAAGFASHTGLIVLEFPPGPREAPLAPAAFLDALDVFLGRLPREFRYAVELRDRALLGPAYHDLLTRHGVSHTFNYWSAMPGLLAQARAVPPEDSPSVVLRLLLKPGTWYEDQRDKFRPFNRLVEPDDAMRDEVVALTTRALARGRKVYVLVNNKAEGSSPLTIEAIAERLAAALGTAGDPSA